MVNAYNATKVFLAGVWIGVVALLGFNWLTRDARGPACIIPFMPAAYACVADPKAAGEQLCRCSGCGMETKR